MLTASHSSYFFRIYALFAGQPLALLNATGPVLVFEGILYNFCKYVTVKLHRRRDIYIFQPIILSNFQE